MTPGFWVLHKSIHPRRHLLSCLSVAAALLPLRWLVQGKHTLTLQFANALHESYGPKWNSSITVNVQ